MGTTGQCVVVTGGASGIGQAIAVKMASTGVAVVVADQNEKGAAETASKLSGIGVKTLAVACDVADENNVKELFERSLHLTGRIDGMAHCAGIGAEKTIVDTSLDDWNRIIAINLTGTFLCARAAAEIMISQRYGRMLLMGSAAGERGGTGRSAYGASKGGVHALMRVLATELAELNITVNAMAPGAIETALVKRMHDAETRESYCAGIAANRYGTPDEVAEVAAFLLSEASAYVNGVVMPIDGAFLSSGVIKRRMNPTG